MPPAGNWLCGAPEGCACGQPPAVVQARPPSTAADILCGCMFFPLPEKNNSSGVKTLEFFLLYE